MQIFHYFPMCTNASCRIKLAQHDAATPVLQSWDVVFRLASFSYFSPSVTVIIVTKHYILVWSDNSRCCSNLKTISLGSICCNADFHVAFGEMAFLLRGFQSIGTELVSLWIITLWPAAATIFRPRFSFVLGSIYYLKQKMLIIRWENLRTHIKAFSHGMHTICIV